MYLQGFNKSSINQFISKLNSQQLIWAGESRSIATQIFPVALICGASVQTMDF